LGADALVGLPLPTGYGVRLSPTSLRTRLLLLVAAAFVPAAILTARNIQADREEALADVRSRLARLLAQADADNDAAIQSGRRIVATWAEVPDVHSGTPAQCAAAFVRLARFAPAVASPTRINLDGLIDCGGRSPQSIGIRVSDNPLFRQVLAGDSAVLGPYLAADSSRAALVPINMPLRDASGRLTGMISVGIRLDWFERLSRNSDLPAGALVTVSDSTGLLLAHYPASPFVGKIRAGLAARFEADRRRGAQERGWIVRNTLDGVLRLVSHERLQSYPGSLVRVAVAMPPEVAFAEPNRRARTRVALLLGTALVALLIAWYGAQVVVLRDVDVILRATRRLGSGDLSARTGLDDRAGEIGQLAQSFDAMASQLEYRQERMRHAERLESLGTLAGGVAHDFNNMLTAIVGSADLALAQVPPGHPAHDDLLTIKSSASRSSTLTRQLLDFSRRGPLVTRPQRLDQLVQESAALLVRVVPATVSIDVHTRSQRFAQIDAGRIEQAIVNLAVNARDAMPQGGTITIALDDADVGEVAGAPVPPGRWIRLRVSDTGAGIPPDVQRRIFEPFFTTKGAGEGTGLGLSMVYGTVQHHGGHVQVDSVVGRGTNVTIWLPETADEHVAPESAPQIATPVSAAVRVLVAEDQPEVRLLIKRVLERAGYTVLLAANGNEALHLAQSAPDSALVLVTDYDMPGLRGDELALALRAQWPALPVVLMSGFTSEGWPTELVSSPGVALVEKPFSPDSLLQAVLAVRQQTADATAAVKA
jgi:signal transduction histidine kinase/ActR/RegA family two-component response regulator